VKCALWKSNQGILFWTDYPQEIRDEAQIERFVKDIKELSLSQQEIKGILGENGKRLLKI
jgi:predicted TIM-barrel fold metal-dependent hydrolase